MRIHPSLGLALLLSLLGAKLAPAQSSSDDGRPKYQFLRSMEDWSGFEARAASADPSDSIKHVDLNGDGSLWVSFGGRVEARYEVWRDFGFSEANNDSFLLSRALLHADLHAGDGFRFYVEGKSAQATQRDLPLGRRALDMDTLDLQQAFVDVVLPLGDSTLTLRPGRQMLLFGKQRLVSPLPWGNTLRTWDGLTARWDLGRWSLTALATAFVPVHQTHFNELDEDLTLFGLYATRKPAEGEPGLDLYALGNERSNVTVNGTTGDEDRLTLGARVWGPLAAAGDYEVEAAWQTGEVGAGDVNAWFLAAQAGWRPGGTPRAPRLWLGLDMASGDDNVGGDVGTFHQLYPLGHAYFGYIDAIGRQNILDASLGGRWSLDADTSCSLGYHWFRLMERDDALYNAGGAAYRTGFTSREVGSEIDLTLDRRLGKHLRAYAGYSHFFPGAAIAQSGPAEDVDFVYVGASFTF